MREYEVVVLGGERPFLVPRVISLAHAAPAGGVGKSALTVRFVKDSFLEHYDPTIEGACYVAPGTATATFAPHRRPDNALHHPRRGIQTGNKPRRRTYCCMYRPFGHKHGLNVLPARYSRHRRRGTVYGAQRGLHPGARAAVSKSNMVLTVLHSMHMDSCWSSGMHRHSVHHSPMNSGIHVLV